MFWEEDIIELDVHYPVNEDMQIIHSWKTKNENLAQAI
jgi:hypothetical protein